MKIIDEKKIHELIDTKTCRSEIKEILRKAEKMKGLNLEECAKLLSIRDKKLLEMLFNSARKVKMAIYGPRLVLFAPLYCSNFCVNDCEYCGFHTRNPILRKKLTMEEVKEQVKILEGMGHKRLLLEFGEHPSENSIDYVTKVIKTIYAVKKKRGEIRRVNINIAATTIDNYRRLKASGIGTYQLFQETYHRPTYEKMHHGPKADYDRQITAHLRAFEGGIDDLGIGVLFGLYDFRFEVLALVRHAQFMNKVLGVGPHTISVPRLQPAHTVNLNSKYKVSDEDFLKLIAVLRLAVPYTGMIISTREKPEIRQKAFAIGISQASAASSAEPGGYEAPRARVDGRYRDMEHEAKSVDLRRPLKIKSEAQFTLNDHRGLDEVVLDICRLGYLPSFCTACYRIGRTGEAFMKLAKSGKINNFCQPNAILTFKEYLLDYASSKTKKAGEQTIIKQLDFIKDKSIKEKTIERLKKLEKGQRDFYF